MSKVFLVRLSRYSIYKVQSLAARAVSLFILARRFPFVKHFFQVFSNYFSECFVSPSRDDLDILAEQSYFVNIAKHTKWEPLSRLPIVILLRRYSASSIRP